MPKKKVLKVEKKANAGLQADVYNPVGKVVGKISLPGEIFAVSPNPALIAQAVRVYLANQRSGTHATKTRSQVSGSTRKIYRQKGTGRARHGDIKAPIFIGGGIVFGPKPRDYSLSLSKQMRKKALFVALSDKLQQGKVKIISGLENIQAKTKGLVEVFTHLHLIDKKQDKILLIIPNQLRNVFLAGRNLSYLTITDVSLLNTYAVLTSGNLLFTKEAVSRLTDGLVASPKQASQKVAAEPIKRVTKKEKKEIKTKTPARKVKKGRKA